MKKFRLRRRSQVASAILAIAMAALVTTAAIASPDAVAVQATVAVPAVQGPIPSTAAPGDPSHNYVFYATTWNLQQAGYVEEEYIVSGTATRYPNPAGSANPMSDAAPIGTMPYTTRIVVRKPADPRKFTGVVLVDWENVTAGHDIDTEWTSNGDFFMRNGWAEIAATTQRVGVDGGAGLLGGNGLKQWNPVRYGALDLTNGGTVLDDSQSFDVYSQIGQLAKSESGPFAGYDVQHVYAAGVSQSSRYLSVYYNTIQHQAGVYDGFVPGLGGLVQRTDLQTKYLRVNTETDVWRGQADPAIRAQSGLPSIHIWEIAGASHVPQAAISETVGDPRSNLGWLEDRDLGPSTARNCRFPYASHVEVWAVFHAAYAALDRWVSDGVAPALPAPIETNGQTAGFWNIVRDANGIALGGIRLPAVQAPVARNDGMNFPSPTSTNPLDAFCILYGTHVPFSGATLDALYPNHGAYVSQFTQAANDAVKQGVLLRPEAQTLFGDAAHSGTGKKPEAGTSPAAPTRRRGSFSRRIHRFLPVGSRLRAAK